MSLQSIERAVKSANQAVLGPRSALNTGTATAVQLARGAAYQLVSASCAQSVATAATVMGQTGTVCGAAMATIAAKCVADPTQAPLYTAAIEEIAKIAAWSVNHFTAASNAAKTVATGYPAM